MQKHAGIRSCESKPKLQVGPRLWPKSRPRIGRARATRERAGQTEASGAMTPPRLKSPRIRCSLGGLDFVSLT